MANYKVQVEHAAYWRGKVHRWSTAWAFTGSFTNGTPAQVIAAIKSTEQANCYPSPTGVNGGIASIAIYNEDTGGVPIASALYFDWTNTSTWVPYGGTAWSARTRPAVNQLEVALLVEWNAGLSSKGKPVKFRKWFHAVPDNDSAPGVADVLPADVTGIASSINSGLAVVAGFGLLLGRGSRLAATTCVVSPYYNNHQIPRGRRRKALVTAAGHYTGPSVQIPNAISVN
jgi:hypothetical protein